MSGSVSFPNLETEFTEALLDPPLLVAKGVSSRRLSRREDFWGTSLEGIVKGRLPIEGCCCRLLAPAVCEGAPIAAVVLLGVDRLFATVDVVEGC